MTSKSGFTLIEILIALMVFAILAAVTSSAMHHAFNARGRINVFADALSQLQLAVALIDQDTSQIVNRPVRANQMKLFPAFIGKRNSIVFTRAGVVNPNQTSKRSTLQRVGLYCKSNRLIRRSWLQLDMPNSNHFEDKVLLDSLEHCSFKYRDNQGQVLREWLYEVVNTDQKQQALPTVIEMRFTPRRWGTLNLTFIIPEALYANV